MSKIIKIKDDCPAYCPYAWAHEHTDSVHRLFKSNLACRKIAHYLPRSLSIAEETCCSTRYIFAHYCCLRIIEK
jgi:hypothetical protein